MKLAAGYIVFDGLETLEDSIKSIRSQVDVIIVSYQQVSWGGTKASPELIPKLIKLQKLGLIDHILEFTRFRSLSIKTPNDALLAKTFELNKRQECFVFAKRLGCTHYMSIDADEFYTKDDMRKAKKYIKDNNLDATAVHYINYVTPTLHRGYSQWLVPFIYRITPNVKHHALQTFFSGIDPTRGMLDENYKKWEVLDKNLISMHHMEMIRDDLIAKYLASSRYFPNRDLLPILEDDIKKSKDSKQLIFSRAHLGDTKDPKQPQKLFECKNLFNIKI